MTNEKPVDAVAAAMLADASRLAQLAERLKKLGEDGNLDGQEAAKQVLDIRNSVLASLSAYLKQPREG